ncbi:MAG TPA: YchF/TatD family DNA exonuclease [Candidatus Dormibacteraeota bacterium]|nr:YchF/TatD family DNA exonuclease [Candidatus Dormibacteraeota bacterium]
MADPFLIDAHCHLDEVARRGVPVTQALANAHRSGVHQVVTSGDGLLDSREACRLAELHEEVFFTVGWHPMNRLPPTDSEAEELRQLLSHPKAVAVGEIGLDYLERPGHLETPRDLQREMFAMMLVMAAELHLPAVIHLRQAHSELLEVLDGGPSVPAMLHCFSGDQLFVAAARERGLMCSFAGNVTFRSARELQSAIVGVPSELLLLETDAPFLAPDQYRGKVNEPAMLRTTATWVAARRGECLDSLARVVTENIRQFLHLPPA